MGKSITLHGGLDLNKDGIGIATADMGATVRCDIWAPSARNWHRGTTRCAS